MSDGGCKNSDVTIHPLEMAYLDYIFDQRQPAIDFRVVGIGEHMLRIFGWRRTKGMYGSEGDQIAENFQESGWDWADGADQEGEPAFIALSKRNEILAYMILAGAALIVALFVLHFTRQSEREAAMKFKMEVPLASAAAASAYGQDLSSTRPQRCRVVVDR